MIKTFRHALSLDERRAKFVPTFWQLPVKKTSTAAAAANGSAKKALRKKLFNPFTFLKRTASDLSDAMEGDVDPEEDESSTCDVKEVWFAGCHSGEFTEGINRLITDGDCIDVGGGAQNNDNQSTLADISLRWMVREVVASQCGIQFDSSMMEKYDVHVDLSPELYYSPSLAAGNSKTSNTTAKSSAAQPEPSSQDQTTDKVDATMPEIDELTQMPLAALWWILEIIPFPFSWQDEQGQWHTRWKLHMGEGRYMNHTSPLYFHETVRIRMNDATLKYTPKLHYPKGKEEYVW